MIQLVSKETYYKNNQELIQAPKYKLYYYSRTNVEEKKENILFEMYKMYDGTYYWRVASLEKCEDGFNISEYSESRKVIIDTVKAVLNKDGINSENSVTMEEYMGTKKDI